MGADQRWWRQLDGGPQVLEGNRGRRISSALVIISMGMVLATGPPTWLAVVALVALVLSAVVLVRTP